MKVIAYHRPQTLEDALALLARSGIPSVPLGGGTVLNREGRSGLPEDGVEVVDLQNLGLNVISAEGDQIQIGATVTLQTLSDYFKDTPALAHALNLEYSFNLQQIATIAGQLVSSDGHSALTTALLALNARLNWEPGGRVISLGDWLALRRWTRVGSLVTRVSWSRQPVLGLEVVARSPLDRPLVCVAVAAWPSRSTPGGFGRTRLALGGFGEAPLLVLDGPESGGAELAAQAACSNAEDTWASAGYRQEIAGILTRRALAGLMAFQQGVGGPAGTGGLK